MLACCLHLLHIHAAGFVLTQVREQLLKSEKEGDELRMLLQNEKRRQQEVEMEFSDAQAQMTSQSEAFRAGVAKIAQLREDEARAVQRHGSRACK